MKYATGLVEKKSCLKKSKACNSLRLKHAQAIINPATTA